MKLLSEILGAKLGAPHPNSRIADALRRAGVPKTAELLRVLNLPRRLFDENDGIAYPDASILYAKPACGNTSCAYCANGGPKLRPIQNALLIEAALHGGCFANIGVGGGKTLPSFLLHEALEVQRTVLLVPPQLRTKTLKIDYPELSAHFRLPPVYTEKDAGSQRSGVYVIAYSELSQTDASDLLERIAPDLIVADEAHNLRHKDSARTRRFLRFMRKNPCKFVPMTGSPLSESIVDFAHLVELALGAGSPLPNDYPSLTAWADAIDNEGEAGATGIGALVYFCNGNESARDGFRRRLSETPGVINTIEMSATGVSIELREWQFTPPADVQKAIQKLNSEWAWDGEEYSNAIDIARLEKSLAQGFFYRLKWPNGVPDREWQEAKNAWARALRQRLTHQNRAGQDSPALLEAMAERGDWCPPEWVDWLKVRDRPEPQREAIEISHWLAERAWSWGNFWRWRDGIIWVSSPVVGNQLKKLGIDYYGEGEDDRLLFDTEVWRKSGKSPPVIALSIQAHGTGKNLQIWRRNLFLYPMSSASTWEQAIGRTHRPGQKDTVEIDVIISGVASQKAWDHARNRAAFAQQTTGQPQRLNVATICENDERF